jgi:hypothetical protein
MPDLSAERAARAMLSTIDLWAEFALGPADFISAGPNRPLVSAAQRSPLLDELYRMYQSYLADAISESTWNETKRGFKIVLSTAWFRVHWKMWRAEYPERFCQVIRELSPNLAGS